MLRGLAKTRHKIMCEPLLSLCKRSDVRTRPLIRVGAARALSPKAAAQEEEAVQAAEEWDEGESEADWDNGHDWLPPAAPA